jgi:hypothetical protein
MEQSQPCCLSKSSLVSYDDGHKMMTLMCMTLWDRRARYVKHTGMFSENISKRQTTIPIDLKLHSYYNRPKHPFFIGCKLLFSLLSNLNFSKNGW